MNEKIISSTDGSLSKISLNLLLVFYVIQRKQGGFGDDIITFDRKKESISGLKPELQEKILSICQGSIPNFYNALHYLNEEALISFRKDEDSSSHNFFDIRVTSNGTKIIEGIDKGDIGKKVIENTFNIHLSERIVNVESLLKINLESIFKGSVF